MTAECGRSDAHVGHWITVKATAPAWATVRWCWGAKGIPAGTVVAQGMPCPECLGVNTTHYAGAGGICHDCGAPLGDEVKWHMDSGARWRP